MNSKKAVLVLAAIVLACAALMLIRGAMTSENKIAAVYLDGKVIREIELDKLTEPIEFDITENGNTNRVRAERGRIRMISADCSDKVCVNQGWIDNGAVPIVCLPHKITIEIKGGSPELDAVAGGV